jgi:hypothetical protein
VHRDGDADESSPSHLRCVRTLDGDVQRGRGIARLFEKAQRRGNPQGLMAQLVAGDQQNGSGLPKHPAVLAGGFHWGRTYIRAHGYLSS